MGPKNTLPPLPEIDHGLRIKLGFVGVAALVVLVLSLSVSGCIFFPCQAG